METMLRLASRIARSHFFRNVLVLMTGTVLAQTINVAFVPVLSRIYDPATYGAFSVFLSIVTIVSCVSTLRYDVALMLPKDDADAACILGLCGIVLVSITCLLGIACLTFGKQAGALLDTPEIVPWLWLLPFSVLFLGVWQSFASWSTRRKQFHRASISQVTRALTSSGFQTAAGLYSPGVLSLILGTILGNGAAAAVFTSQLFKFDWPVIRGSMSLVRIRRLAREYSDFPMYATPQLLLNTVSQNVPMLLLSHYFGPAVVGYYAFGVRVVQLPVSLITDSLRSVLFQKASEVYNSGGDTYSLFKKTTLGLMGVAALSTLPIILFAPMVVAFVLGDQWYTAGEYARWLVLWIAFGLFEFPAAIFGQIYLQQRMLLCTGILTLVFRVLTIVIGGTFFTALHTVMLFSIAGIVFNSFSIAWIWIYLRRLSLKSA